MASATSTPRDDLRKRVRFYLLDHRTPVGKAIDIALLALNLAFIGVFVAQTYSLGSTATARLWTLEVLIAAVFAVEYALRLYGVRNRLAEFANPYTIVDLLSILSTVAVIVDPLSAAVLNVGFLRALRVIRVLRFYRFTRDEEFFFGAVSAGALRATKLLLTVLDVLFVSAGLFYSVEERANTGVANFGDAFYYVVVTLTTVGFGDIVPVTRAGRWITVLSISAAIIADTARTPTPSGVGGSAYPPCIQPPATTRPTPQCF